MTVILFLCTGNSCRSQMAEGFARSLLDQTQYAIKSAGLEAHGLNQRAVTAMADIGLDISAQKSTLLDRELLDLADVIVTLCGHAEEHCPLVPKETKRFHWPLDDPAKVSGSEEKTVMAFKETRDAIGSLVAELPGQV